MYTLFEAEYKTQTLGNKFEKRQLRKEKILIML